MADEFPNSVAAGLGTVVRVPVQSEARLRGVIDTLGDVDVVGIQLVAGARYQIFMVAQAPALRPVLDLMDDTGAVLATSRGGSFSPLTTVFAEFVAPRSGLYYLSAQDGDNRQTGAYDLFAEIVSNSFSIAAVGSAERAEGNVNGAYTDFQFTLTRNAGSVAEWSKTVSVDYRVTSQQAVAADFKGGVFPSGTVQFGPGETSKLITVSINQDTLVETDEAFTVTLAAPTAGVLSPEGSSATALIRNDDAVGALSISAIAADSAEGSVDGATSSFLFSVARQGDISRSASVTYAVSSQQAGAADFVGAVLPSGTLQFAAGESTRTLSIPVAQDGLVEPDESFTVTLSNPVAASLAVASADGVIRNDDQAGAVSLSALSAEKLEGSTAGASSAFTFEVIRQGDLTQSASVEFGVSGAQVTEADFAGNALPRGLVQFAPGESAKTISIPVAQDLLFEPDERFNVTLSSPVGLTLGSAVAVGLIRNDDAQPGNLSVAALEADKPEGSASGASTAYTFSVTRSGNTDIAASVAYQVSSQEASAADFAGNVFPSGTLQFAVGETVKTVSVPVANDTTVETDESFTLSLSSPQGAVVVGANANGLIRNDDVEAPALVPVYRFAKISNGAYFLTGSQAESDQIARSFPDFRAEGVGFFAYADSAVGTPVYRFANLNNGGYFYTGSAAERDATIVGFPNLRFEGSTFSVASPSTQGALPVYRLANLTNGAYLYTTAVGERDAAQALGTWRYEGISFYSPPGSSLPPAPPTDDFLASTATTGRLGFVSAVSGKIETAGDVDWFAVTLEAGQQYAFSASAATTGGVKPAFDLIGANGTVLASRGNTDAVSTVDLSFTSSAAGTYYVAVRGAGAAATGGYSLTGALVDTSLATIEFVSSAAIGIAEGSAATPGGITVTVQRAGNITSSASVSLLFIPDSASAADVDLSASGFAANSRTVSFAPGQTTQSFRFLLKGDDVKEADEAFFLRVIDGVNANIGSRSQLEVRIQNDDSEGVGPGGAFLPGGESLAAGAGLAGTAQALGGGEFLWG